MRTKSLFTCPGAVPLRAGRRRDLLALIAVLNLIPAGRVTAQTFTTLHSFTYSDRANPQAGLILSGNTLYGTAAGGGSAGGGTVFAVNTDGTGFTNVHNFTALVGPYPGTNSDGANPQAGLILSGNTLYGTAGEGGNSDYGTVFKVNTNGTGFTNLHSFTTISCFPLPPPCLVPNSDGANPLAGLVLSGNTLYGTAAGGGSSSDGTVFAVNTDGTGFTNLHSFTGSDGAGPQAELITSSSGNTLYGTAWGGGSSGAGTVFAVNSDGTGFTNLHSFTAIPSYPTPSTNSDGGLPNAGLILSGNTLYGTAVNGGSSENGTVFAVNTDGTGFTNLHSFTATSGSFPNSTNSDGANPYGGLTLPGNTLYGTTYQGGISGRGTVFAVNTDGTGFTNLHSFTATDPNTGTNSDGALPRAGLILSGDTLYGTAANGGSSGNGTVFSISFQPQLTIVRSGVPPSGIILTWPTNVAGFDYTGYTLQSTTNLVSPVVWSANSPAPIVIAGQNTVTNPITAAQQFFRLVR